MRVVARNYRCRAGEIDLVMSDRGALVFVEVRYRRDARFGTALETITPRKRARLVRAASHFLQSHPRLQDSPCRFDSIGIDGEGEAATIQWIRDAFAA